MSNSIGTLTSNKIYWLTGLPSAGKTTIAKELVKYIPNCILLDGDEIRDSYISQGLGFSKEDRDTHLLRVADIAKICSQTSTVVCAFVSPHEDTRRYLKQYIGKNFVEVYVHCDLETCIRRDVKGLYAKACAGEIKNFTGIGQEYQAPENPDILVNTSAWSLKTCVEVILGAHRKPAHMYIGRWNGVFHKGHEHIINQRLENGEPVLLAVRDVMPDANNPWTAVEVKEMLDDFYHDNDLVQVIIIPDIASVNYGRGVGYEVNKIESLVAIEAISGTKCREMIKNGEDVSDYVPKKIIQFLNKKFSV